MTNDVTITENRGVIYLHGSDGHKALIPRETVALRAYFAAESVPEDVQALVDGLRLDARNYGRKMRGEIEPGETFSWDRSEERAWEAAAALEAAYSQRDALAAVIERIRNLAENDDPGAWDAHQELVREILSRVPSEALAERDARRDRGVAANALREFAKKVYNGASRTRDANFQAFYDYGLHPVLTAEAHRIERGGE